MKRRITRFVLTSIIIGALALSGCGGAAQKTPKGSQPNAAQTEKEAADEGLTSGPYWLIEASDSKNFAYTIPNISSPPAFHAIK